MKNSNLSAGLEDYIEAIYIATVDNKTLKGAELARMLNISRASVSEALSKLVSKGLIKYESYGTVSLTPIGAKEAQNVYTKHKILKNFFETVLGISPDEASENACKIEHIVSEQILERIDKLTSHCSKNPDITELFKQ
jgi:DtxR family Mn-dependent transcriptional regulator